MKVRIVEVLLLLPLVLLLLGLTVWWPDPYVFQTVFYLIFGWVSFLFRVLPAVTVNWNALFIAVFAGIVFVVAFQRTANCCYSEYQRRRGDEPKSWPVKWTGGVTAVVFILFCAGITVVGMAHQGVWLITAREPLTEEGMGSGRRRQSKNNLKQIGLAFHNYYDTFQSLPAGGTFDRFGRLHHSWMTRLLPYVDEAPTYNQIDFHVPWDDPQNSKPIGKVVADYVNWGVSDPAQTNSVGQAISHYAANGRVVGGAGLSLSEITDGTTHTILAGEVNNRFKPWGYPANWRDPQLGINKSPNGFGGPWIGGSHFLLGDGSVRFIAENVDSRVLKALSTPAGGEVVGEY